MIKLSANERISRWKSLRKNIDVLSFDDACHQVLNFWNNLPYVPYYLDVDNTSLWPDPWQLLVDNYYCDIAKCLGIIYTLHLSKHGNNLNPELRVYYSTSSKHTFHIAYLCDGKYVLNLIDNEIVNNKHINQNLKLIHCYTAADLKLEQY